MNLFLWQTIYYLSAVVLLPVAPFLYLQGQLVRRKVGVLPDAGGATTGVSGTGKPGVGFLAIGESTVAGLGAETHEKALTGQFAGRLSVKIGRRVRWRAIGRNGVTAKRTLRELVPLIPADEKYDYVLLGTCGNDVLKLSSPWKFRRWTIRLIAHMQTAYPGAQIFITNAPVIRLSPVLPQPIRWILGHLSAMHDKNIQEFTAGMEKVFYFHQPQEVNEGFFSDGIHPSEKGYSDWSDAMIEFFTRHYKW
jgi:lysophospholipase L1-like esterase